MIGWLARRLLSRETVDMIENLLWIRDHPDAVVDEEMAAWVLLDDRLELAA